MSFISIKFVVFFILLVISMLLIKEQTKQKIVLLAFSYIFYALGDCKFLVLIFGVSVLMWFLGIRITKDTVRSKVYLVVGVSVDVIVLGIFKYFNFFASSFASAMGKDYIELKILLPLGISFYIFQSISYLADVYMKKIDAEKSLLNVLLYIGFFPQIVSGPIVKAHDFLPQLKEDHSISKESFSSGMQLFLIGLFKKVVLADRLAVCVDAVYSSPNAYDSFSILMAVVSYSLQIYYDFSGYSDMAIGVARVLGFDLGKNFNLPYLAKNPSDFWRRWHISLSSWFRDYVYFPLGGSRKGRFRTYLNLFITMLLSGLWHGASWAFVLWGSLHALLSVFHKAFCDVKKKAGMDRAGESKFGNAISVIMNYICVTLLWIPFRTNDMGEAILILRRMFSMKPGIHYVNVFSILFIVLLLAVEILAISKNDWNNPIVAIDLSRFWNKVLFVCFAFIIIVFSYVGNTAFIYAQF